MADLTPSEMRFDLMTLRNDAERLRAELKAARDETERACAAEALTVYQRDILAEACRSFLAQLDYLQDLWSKEGVTNTVAEKARHALKTLDGDTDK